MKKKLAFVDLTNFIDWPVGGMLQYELTILKYLNEYFDIDLWGVSVDGKSEKNISLNNTNYHIKIWGNVKTKNKILPNYWRGLFISKRNKDCFKDYDYIYVHTGSCAVGLNFIINHNYTKLIYHQHGLSHLNDYSIMSLIQRPFVNWAQRISDIIFIVSSKKEVENYVKRSMNGASGKFLHVLSPIELDNNLIMKTRDKIPNKKKINKFIYTGRLDSHKDVKTVIKAFSIYHKNHNDATLTIVGEGDKRKELEDIVTNLKLKESITFTGAVPHQEINNYLSSADVYLTASIGEGMSIAVLEAYMNGLPIVCFDVPGLCQQVINGKTGVVINERDPVKMYEGMILAISNYKKLALGCLDEVKKYDAKELSKYIALNIMED
ncbi:MAG: glycosyltransferase family 4 protein [Amedibacillus dolichus]|uniref:Glycosyltransferase family 4 protein n=1 Tax=Amedibacillus dolichus TaxID=31971 RepID=A0A942ZZQ1_9FIRM|nr:glycosyltransferase family 4 protein [Amedibacillus dolichus]MBS4884443.1 glycosyltransferase family 4 protein [Amedibacillus dolichus]